MSTVGLNLLWLVPGVVGGSEEYTLQLLRTIDRIDPDDLELRIYAQPSFLEAHPDLSTRFEVVEAPRVLAGKVARVGTEMTWLRSSCRHDNLVHHAGSVVPLTSPRPYVFTVLDLQPLDVPSNFSPMKRAWLRHMLPRSIVNSSLVITPSEFVAEGVRRRFSLDHQRLKVVPHGHQSLPAGERASRQSRELRSKYGRFFLFPGISYPHKRHRDLVDAFASVAVEFDDVSIVFTGGQGPESSALTDQIHQLGLDARVHRLGRVPEAVLDDLYRAATALVFPSEYEGFGIPVLEAMVRGCPVICTDAGSLPEVVGTAGLTVSTRSPEALAAAMRRLLTEPDLADELADLGAAQAKHFGSRSAGVALLEAYRDALSRADR